MSEHSFDTAIAKKYGTFEAIFVKNMVLWTQTNAAKKSKRKDGSLKHFHEERWWAFGTPAFFSAYFPYIKERHLKDILKSCVKQGLLLKNNFNEKKYDRTNWYSLSDSVLIELNLSRDCLNTAETLIGRNPSNGSDVIRPMDKTKSVQPIPDTKPDTKNTITEQSSAAPISSTAITPVELVRVYQEELPNNPKVVVNHATGGFDRKLLKAIKELKKHYEAKEKSPLTEELFRCYIQGIKEDLPQLAEGIYEKNGRRNGLMTFIKVEFFENYINDNFYNQKE